jgi:hypothetical protein
MNLLALTALVSVATPDPFPAPRTPTPVLRISCRQGECQWQQIKTIERVRAGREMLRKVTSRTGSSTYSVYKNPPAWSRKLRIAWQKAPSIDYVLCSKRRPATAFWDKDERKWIVTSLDLTGLGGYQYAAATLYMKVCHNLGPGRWSERRNPRLGYGKTPSGQERYATVAEMMKALE